MKTRAYVAVVKLPDESGFQSFGLVNEDRGEAEYAALIQTKRLHVHARLLGVFTQEDVTAFGMALAMARASIDGPTAIEA